MAAATVSSRPRLKERYDNQVRAELKETLGLDNIMEVPRLTKIAGNGPILAQAMAHFDIPVAMPQPSEDDN